MRGWAHAAGNRGAWGFDFFGEKQEAVFNERDRYKPEMGQGTATTAGAGVWAVSHPLGF